MRANVENETQSAIQEGETGEAGLWSVRTQWHKHLVSLQKPVLMLHTNEPDRGLQWSMLDR